MSGEQQTNEGTTAIAANGRVDRNVGRLRPERIEMEPMECQYHNNCGGWCETDEEREQCLCCDCLEAEREEDAEQQRGIEMGKALQRIAVAAGIELAKPGEIADIVCARLSTPNV